jgi:hypothetical protein
VACCDRPPAEPFHLRSVSWRLVAHDGVVPFAVEVVWGEGDGGEFGVGDSDAFLIPVGSWAAWTVSPVEVVVAEISSMMVRRLVRGRPRQFMVMNENMRCSIRFHFEVPGG